VTVRDLAGLALESDHDPPAHATVVAESGQGLEGGVRDTCRGLDLDRDLQVVQHEVDLLPGARAPVANLQLLTAVGPEGLEHHQHGVLDALSRTPEFPAPADGE
jgi:hypothetical protein